MKKLLASLALWLAKRASLRLVPLPKPEYIATAHEFAAHCDRQAEPWEWKQRQTLRATRQRHPQARIRDLNLAIEIAVQERARGRA